MNESLVLLKKLDRVWATGHIKYQTVSVLKCRVGIASASAKIKWSENLWTVRHSLQYFYELHTLLQLCSICNFEHTVSRSILTYELWNKKCHFFRRELILKLKLLESAILSLPWQKKYFLSLQFFFRMKTKVFLIALLNFFPRETIRFWKY